MRTNINNNSVVTAQNAHLREAVRCGQWIVGSISNGEMSFSARPVTHASEALARQEAARLAKLNPGKSFIWAKLSGGVMSSEVQFF